MPPRGGRKVCVKDESELCPECGGPVEADGQTVALLVCKRCRLVGVRAGVDRLPLITRSESGHPRLVANVVLSPEFIRRFSVVRLLGTGAAGTVYLAQRPSGEMVAVKVLTQSQDVETSTRFIREGDLMTSIDHPNVVRVLEVGEFAGYPYLVSEYVAGGTLRAKLKLDGRLGVAAAVQVTRGILAGLAACHERGIVHRDVKPENILLTEAGEPKVADLGAAKDPEAAGPALTQAGCLLGTPAYMSPEMILHEPVGPPADLYATGLMLYEMLAGVRPFATTTVADALRRQVVEEPRQIRELVPEVPEAVARLVHQTLAKKPADRPPSAKALARALATAMRPGVPASDPREQPTRREPPPSKGATVAVGQQAPAVSDEKPAALVSRAWILAMAGAALAGFVAGGALFWRVPAPAPLAPASLSPKGTAAVTAPPGDPPEVGEIRAIEASVERAPLSLRPWPGSPRASTAACPFVVLCGRLVESVVVEPLGAEVHLPSGKVVMEKAEMPWGQTGLVDGFNWIEVRGGVDGQPAARISLARPEHVSSIVPTSRPPPQVRLHSKVLADCAADLLNWNVDLTREAVEAARAGPGDPLKRFELARIDLALEEKVTRIDEAYAQNEDLPLWTDKTKLSKARALLDVIVAALAADPGRWDLWHEVGVVLERTGSPDAGRAALVRALSVWPESCWSWLELGRLEKRLLDRSLREGAVLEAALRRRATTTDLLLARKFHAEQQPVAWIGVEIESLMRAATVGHSTGRSGVTTPSARR